MWLIFVKCYRVSLYHFRVNPRDVFGSGVSDSETADIFQVWSHQEFVGKVFCKAGLQVQVPPEESQGLIFLGDNATDNHDGSPCH